MRPHLCLVASFLAFALSAGRAQEAGNIPAASPAAAKENAPGASGPLPPLRNRFGETLRRPRVIAFDGATFQVEHADGVAAVPWDAMPEAWRRGFRRDPARAAAAQERRRQAVEARSEADEVARRDEPAPAPPPPLPTVIELKLPLGDLSVLPTIGGPEGELRIWRVSQTEVTFERRRYASQTVEKKLGFNSPRTLLFDDDRGCRVYFVDRSRSFEDRRTVTVQFEYAPGREPPADD